MSAEKMREEFEAAVSRDWPRANLNQCDFPGSLRLGQYVDECIQHAWWGWQASRAALVIELPAVRTVRTVSVPFVFAEDVKAAIEAAGLKVKP